MAYAWRPPPQLFPSQPPFRPLCGWRNDGGNGGYNGFYGHPKIFHLRPALLPHPLFGNPDDGFPEPAWKRQKFNEDHSHKEAFAHGLEMAGMQKLLEAARNELAAANKLLETSRIEKKEAQQRYEFLLRCQNDTAKAGQYVEKRVCKISPENAAANEMETASSTIPIEEKPTNKSSTQNVEMQTESGFLDTTDDYKYFEKTLDKLNIEIHLTREQLAKEKLKSDGLSSDNTRLMAKLQACKKPDEKVQIDLKSQAEIGRLKEERQGHLEMMKNQHEKIAFQTMDINQLKVEIARKHEALVAHAMQTDQLKAEIFQLCQQLEVTKANETRYQTYAKEVRQKNAALNEKYQLAKENAQKKAAIWKNEHQRLSTCVQDLKRELVDTKTDFIAQQKMWMDDFGRAMESLKSGCEERYMELQIKWEVSIGKCASTTEHCAKLETELHNVLSKAEKTMEINETLRRVIGEKDEQIAGLLNDNSVAYTALRATTKQLTEKEAEVQKRASALKNLSVEIDQVRSAQKHLSDAAKSFVDSVKSNFGQLPEAIIEHITVFTKQHQTKAISDLEMKLEEKAAELDASRGQLQQKLSEIVRIQIVNEKTSKKCFEYDRMCLQVTSVKRQLTDVKELNAKAFSDLDAQKSKYVKAVNAWMEAKSGTDRCVNRQDWADNAGKRKIKLMFNNFFTNLELAAFGDDNVKAEPET